MTAADHLHPDGTHKPVAEPARDHPAVHVSTHAARGGSPAPRMGAAYDVRGGLARLYFDRAVTGVYLTEAEVRGLIVSLNGALAHISGG